VAGHGGDLVNELATELVVLLQHLVPQVTVHALHNVSSLDLEQTADNHSWSVPSQITPITAHVHRKLCDSRACVCCQTALPDLHDLQSLQYTCLAHDLYVTACVQLAKQSYL